MGQDKDESAAPHEYAGERDMDAFWDAAQLESEPARHRWYVPVIALLVLFAVPWYFTAGEIGPMIAGLPLWVWVSLGCAFGLACVTAVGVLRLWKSGAPERE